jgi:shikimate dehydrogenase
MPLETDAVTSAVEVIRELKISGVSVTSPHKVEIMDYLDEVDAVAREIGAVNTVIKTDDRLIGFNTDGSGAAKALEVHTDLRDKNIVVLGAGGAARALVCAIRKKGGKVIVLNRTVEKAKRLAKDVGIEFGGLERLGTLKPDILINATSVGYQKESLVPKELLKNMLVMDIVYRPLETRLLKDARQAECETIEGVEMYIHQCAEQFRLFTGRTAPMGVLRRIAREALIEREIMYS